MEKYTQFRDKSTGISPFMPHPHSQPAYLIPLQLVLSSIKLLISLPLWVMLVLATPLQFVQRRVLRLILFVYGLWSYEVNVQGVKRFSDGFLPSKNEVYFVSFTSLLDYLAIWLISQDSFVVLIAGPQGLKSYSLIQFVFKSLGFGNGVEFDVKQLTNKIVYIFPEGTTSNGKALLPFQLTEQQWDQFYAELNQDHKTHKLKTLSIKLIPSYLTTPLPLPLHQYLFRVLSQLYITLKLRINFVEDDSLDKVKSAFIYNGKLKQITIGDTEKTQFIKVYKGRR